MKITLKAARVNAGLSSEEAAKELGVTRLTLYNWENNKISPRIEYVRKMCELYNCPFDMIRFGGK